MMINNTKDERRQSMHAATMGLRSKLRTPKGMVLILIILAGILLVKEKFYPAVPESSGYDNAVMRSMIHQKRTTFIQQARELALQSNDSVLYFRNLKQCRAWIVQKLSSDNVANIDDLKVLAIWGLLYKTARCDHDRRLMDSVAEREQSIGGELVLPNLQQVILNDLGLMKVSAAAFTKLVSLKYLSLVGNCLRTLPTGLFSSQTNLEVVDLRYNQLKHINMESLNQLDLLDLSNNPLTSVDNMRLGSNQRDAVYVFENTNLQDIQFCYEELEQQPQENADFPAIYIGERHTIPCSCNIVALEKFIIGSKCVTPPITDNVNKCGAGKSLCIRDNPSVKSRKLLSDAEMPPKRSPPVEEFVEYLPTTHIVALCVCLGMSILLCILGYCIYRSSKNRGVTVRPQQIESNEMVGPRNW